MDIISIDAAATILGLHKSRIEQWISRSQYLPLLTLGRGRKRDWDKSEVIRLAIFVTLVDEVGLSPLEAGRLTQTGVHSFKDDGAYFVCYKVDAPIGPPLWDHDIVRKSQIGNFVTRGCHIPKILESGYGEETLRRNSEKNLGPANLAVIIDLDRIEQQINQGWPG
ncbi:Hypothetical protein NGAL_HAMBI2605_61070 [Neorhizobium galegae bv. orientalis]|nr:Hypothetical protein NGAL_HAMBI2605_61070 [Neorhizobium galegae bv. orientalis]